MTVFDVMIMGIGVIGTAILICFAIGATSDEN